MLETKLNEDGSVEVRMDQGVSRLGAAELDHLMQDLAQLRARMPERVAEQQDRIETVYYNPLYKLRLDKETKACLLSVRHAGYGWLNFELPTQEVLNMRTLWNHVVDRMDLEPPVGLYDGPERRRTKPH